MYFKDLSKYTYLTNKPDGKIVNIGWLEEGYPYSKGDVTKDFLDKLWEYSHFVVASTRGFHVCDLCKNTSKLEVPVIEYNSKKLKIGTAEIRVFGKNGIIYAAPNLLFHYVIKHSYLPPDEFIISVLEGVDPNLDEYQNLLADYFSSWNKLEDL